MGAENADFMLWLGDQIYLPNDNLDRKKMFDTYMFYKTESAKRANFMKHFFHFGIWDDHDYSYNNGTADFSEKEHSTELYKTFWPNSGYASQSADEGIFAVYKYVPASKMQFSVGSVFATSQHANFSWCIGSQTCKFEESIISVS